MSLLKDKIRVVVDAFKEREITEIVGMEAEKAMRKVFDENKLENLQFHIEVEEGELRLFLNRKIDQYAFHAIMTEDQ